MSDILDFIKFCISLIMGGIFVIVFFVVCLKLGEIAIQPDAVIYIDGKEVYRGNAAAFNVTSGGATTTVNIGKGFLYLFPKATYTSKNVEIKPLGKEGEHAD